MKFSTIATFAFAALSVASSPVPPVVENNIVVEKRAIDLDQVLADVESLVGTLITDVGLVAAAAGVNVTEVLGGLGIKLTVKREFLDFEEVVKRDEIIEDKVVATEKVARDIGDPEQAGMKRDVPAIIGAVEQLVRHLLQAIVKLLGDVGLSLLNEIIGLK